MQFQNDGFEKKTKKGVIYTSWRWNTIFWRSVAGEPNQFYESDEAAMWKNATTVENTVSRLVGRGEACLPSMVHFSVQREDRTMDNMEVSVYIQQ